MLSLNLQQSYQLGFLYIRQLCLHLRNTRNNFSQDAVKHIYGWQFYNCVKMWVLALCQHQNELVLLLNPVVQLIQGALKLTVSIKYFPFHVKLFELLNMIIQQANQFIPIAQYLLYPFESKGGLAYLNSKSKPLEDKMIPDSLVSIKISKKHLDTVEMKDKVVQESLENLTLHLADHARKLYFPEMVVGLSFVLRRFKKETKNTIYRKQIQTFLQAVQSNSELIMEKRALLKQKQLKSERLDQVQAMLTKAISKEPTAVEREKLKILKMA